MLTTIISFIILLGILVFFHELGHYWVARRNGIEVEEFGLGYPPRLVKLFTYDGTDFTLNALPLGGFARMKGEDASDMASGSFNAASRGARAATLIAGPLMNAFLAIFLFAASFMSGFPAEVAYGQLTAIDAGSTPATAGLQAGDIVLAVDGKPALISAIPDFEYNVLERSQDAVTPTGTIEISRDGAVMELPYDGSIKPAELQNGAENIIVLTTQILMTAPDSPAELAGLQAGDLVYAVDDTVITPSNCTVPQISGSRKLLTMPAGLATPLDSITMCSGGSGRSAICSTAWIRSIRMLQQMQPLARLIMSS